MSIDIFYENGTSRIPSPLPPLVKRVEEALGCGTTPATQDSVDLAGYLLRAAVDDQFATPAATPEEALKMMFDEAGMGQLSALAVISPDPNAGAKYAGALAQFAGQQSHEDEDEQTVETWRGP